MRCPIFKHHYNHARITLRKQNPLTQNSPIQQTENMITEQQFHNNKSKNKNLQNKDRQTTDRRNNTSHIKTKTQDNKTPHSNSNQTYGNFTPTILNHPNLLIQQNFSPSTTTHSQDRTYTMPSHYFETQAVQPIPRPKQIQQENAHNNEQHMHTCTRTHTSMHANHEADHFRQNQWTNPHIENTATDTEQEECQHTTQTDTTPNKKYPTQIQRAASSAYMALPTHISTQTHQTRHQQAHNYNTTASHNPEQIKTNIETAIENIQILPIKEQMATLFDTMQKIQHIIGKLIHTINQQQNV